MDRLPTLGSLRSIASAYEEDDISDEEELTKSAKKRKLSAEEIEKVETKEENSDYDIVVSDEEGNSSGAGSAKNAVVMKQPKVSTASRLVSYGGDEEEEDEASKVKENKIPPTEGEPSTSADVQTEETEGATLIDGGESSTNVENQPTTQEAKNTEQENEDGALPKKLLDHLAAVKSIHVTLPDEPEGRCSNALQEKIENLLETKKRSGRDLKHTIQRKKNFRNPSIYEKLVAFCSINEIGTNYPEHIYDPFSWTEDSFYERLSKIQKEHHEKKQKDRSKVEFVSATKKSTASTSGEDASKRRRSKWDVTSSGTAALTIPPSAVQTIASVQAAVAAASSQGKRP